MLHNNTVVIASPHPSTLTGDSMALKKELAKAFGVDEVALVDLLARSKYILTFDVSSLFD